MTAPTLVELLRLLEETGIAVWLDGGWGVDALLERQTRPHEDVDLIVAVADAPQLIAVLSANGFHIKEGEPTHSFVLADGAGLEADVHAVTFDEHGNGLYRMGSGGPWIFPAEGFAGRGPVGDMEVRCLRRRCRCSVTVRGTSRPRRTCTLWSCWRNASASSDPRSSALRYPVTQAPDVISGRTSLVADPAP